MSKVLTPARRVRLEKLATYLEALPANYSHFDMGNYIVAAKGDELVAKYALENGGVQHCGTAACAVGHGPAAGILMPKSIVRRFGTRHSFRIWNLYAQMFVGPEPGDRQYANCHLFEWVFGEEWADEDNHHYGAAARIRYLLDKGKPPEGLESPRCKFMVDYEPYRVSAKAQADA